MADKKGRIHNLIQKNLSQIIIYDLKSPVTQFCSITHVEVSSDYSYCKVFVGNVDPEKTEDIVSFLNNRKGRIRTMLAKTLDIYKIPDLIFTVDREFDEMMETEALVKHALASKPRTLKDVYPDYKTPEEIEAEKKAAEKKLAAKKTATKKTAAKKTTTAKKTVRKTATKKIAD